jgi:hypothetical protein
VRQRHPNQEESAQRIEFRPAFEAGKRHIKKAPQQLTAYQLDAPGRWELLGGAPLRKQLSQATPNRHFLCERTVAKRSMVRKEMQHFLTVKNEMSLEQDVPGSCGMGDFVRLSDNNVNRN